MCHESYTAVNEEASLKLKEKWAKNYVESIKKMSRRPGLADVWLAGFEFAQEKLAEEMDKNKDVTLSFIENYGNDESTPEQK